MELGEVRQNKYGTPMRIIHINNRSDIDIEFMDKNHFVRRHSTYVNFKTGSVKNPYDKTCWGVGYLGVGKYIAHNPDGKMCDAGHSWQDMLERCYSEKNKHKHKAYYGIAECCDLWLNFQNFAEWYETHKYKCDGRLHIDKDILYPGNKVYSPFHCLLVPQRINMLFMNKQNDRGLPNGIRFENDRYYAKYRHLELGSYETLEEAYEVYAKEKKKTIVKVAEEYRETIPAVVYEALMNYEVRIENDKNFVSKNVNEQ